MAWRTTEEDVRQIIAADASKLVAPFINTATAVVDYVVTQDTDGLLSDDLKTQIELYLAAHYYEHHDPQYAEKKTGKASAVFQGEWGKGFESSKWGQSALALDVTGTLAKMDKGNIRATLNWLGKPPSEQINVEDRD